VRQLAREFGVELSAVSPSGPHGRVLKEDVQAYVKTMMQKAKEAPAAGLQPVVQAFRRSDCRLQPFR
jgi:pyruvate dehydrogenase E2 component (dihydrolipoamide acetyltransferase)